MIGTYAAPSANNVRVSPQNASGGDCTQMMFADAVYANQDHITITVSDGQTTIMDYTRTVYFTVPANLKEVLDNDLAEGGTGGQGIGYQ